MKTIFFECLCFFIFCNEVFSDSLLGEIETDRPDVTESAQAVEYGHFQFETSVFGYLRDRSQETYDYLNVNAKYGICESSDLQFLFNVQSYDKSQDSDREISFSDLGMRLKHNLINEENFALAVLPFVIFPEHSSDAEYGAAIPFEAPLSDSASLGAMVQLANVNLDPSNGWQSLNTIVFGYDLTGRLGSFFEIASRYTEASDSEYYFNHGFTYLITPQIQADIGLYYGLNPAADNFALSLGFSFKL